MPLSINLDKSRSRRIKANRFTTREIRAFSPSAQSGAASPAMFPVNSAASGAVCPFPRFSVTPVSYTHLDVYKRQVVDYIDVLVHIMGQETREFYCMDTLWKDAPVVEY